MIITAAVTILIVNILLVCLLLFFEQKRPAAMWAWLLLVLFTSLPGFLFYLAVGRSPRRRSLSIGKQLTDEQLRIMLHAERERVGVLPHDESPVDTRWHEIIRFHYTTGTAYLTHGNEVDIFTEGTEKFARLLKSLKEARNSIHLEYYIFRDDTIGNEILSVLIDKAESGIDVKIIHDGLGTWELPRTFFAPLVKAGGRVACFFPPYMPPFRFQLKYRNHRKICIVDNCEAWIGGFNIGDEYLGKDPRFGNWRDTHLRIAGPAVEAVAQCFLLDWQFAARERIDPTSVPRMLSLPSSFGASMQVVTSGPDSRWDSIHDGFFKIISSAHKSLYIQTPYFIPDDSILRALNVAALSGVDVKIMVPDRPDHPFVYWATRSFLGETLDSGIESYIYENGFLHSKLIIADGSVASIGSTNMDIRSFELNFEINAFIYDGPTVARLEKIFLDDLRHCSRLTKQIYDHRSAGQRALEGVARLLSPLM